MSDEHVSKDLSNWTLAEFVKKFPLTAPARLDYYRLVTSDVPHAVRPNSRSGGLSL